MGYKINYISFGLEEADQTLLMEMRKLAILLILAFFATALRAVTPEEMEEARANTALWYLRWANNGSDYLEQLHPKSIAELESKLKQKEQENIKAFKSVGTPKDYASWNQDKLVEYWGVTFFKSPGLNEQGRGAAIKVKKVIGAMNIADPKDVPAPAPAPEPAPMKDSVVAPAPVANPLPTAEEIVEEEAVVDSSMMQEPEPEPVDNEKSEGTTNWIYVIALILLIGVVVWLVVFASKTMQSGKNSDEDSEEKREKRSKKRREEYEAEYEAESIYSGNEKGDKALREKFARTLASKDEEIRVLHREIHDLRAECMKMGEENGRLRSDLNIADRELEALRGRLRAMDVVATAASSVPEAPERNERREDEETPVKVTPRSENRASAAEERIIYLGRVNSQGIFVRADRKPVEGKTVFALTTTDGITGTYRVLQFGPTIDMSLDNPEYYLAGGCVAPDITNTDDAEGIRTVNAGTAIFEDGCWRLLRKAKIAYE